MAKQVEKMQEVQQKLLDPEQKLQQDDEDELIIIGRPSPGKNELEDYWMSKISHLENQYDDHLKRLQSQLFSHGTNYKALQRARADNAYLNYELESKIKQTQGLASKVHALTVQQQTKDRQVKNIQQKLHQTLSTKSALSTALNSKNKQYNDSLKHQVKLRTKLHKMESVQTSLRDDVSRLESQLNQARAIVQDKDSDAVKTKSLLHELNTERIVQAKGNFQLLDGMQTLLKVNASKEDQLYGMQMELDNLMKELKNQGKVDNEISRENMLLGKELQNVQIDLEKSQAQLELKERATKHWKEEFEFSKLMAMKTKHGKTHENVYLRGQIAGLQQQISRLQCNINSYEVERRKLVQQLEILPSLQSSLQTLIQSNVDKQRRTLNIMAQIQQQGDDDEILDDPFDYFRSTKTKADEDLKRLQRPTRSCRTGLGLGLNYQKEIHKLTSQLASLNSQLLNSTRARNSLQFQLNSVSKGSRQQLHWNDVQIRNLKHEKNVLEQIASSSAQQFGARAAKAHFLQQLGSSKDDDDKASKKLLLETMKSQIHRLDQLKRHDSIRHQLQLQAASASINKPDEIQELLKLDSAQLDAKIAELQAQTTALESKKEIMKKMWMGQQDKEIGQDLNGATEAEAEAEEDDVIKQHFIPEDELIETINKAFDESSRRKSTLEDDDDDNDEDSEEEDESSIVSSDDDIDIDNDKKYNENKLGQRHQSISTADHHDVTNIKKKSSNRVCSSTSSSSSSSSIAINSPTNKEKESLETKDTAGAESADPGISDNDDENEHENYE